MAKLHELLAVIQDIEATAKKVMDEALNTFTRKQAHFSGSHKTLKMHDDERAPEAEGQEVYSALVTTVPDKLSYIRGAQEKWYDACLQQEATNQVAVADLVVDGVEIGKGLPATFLLGMESRLKRIRAVIEAAPTHDPTYEWVEDSDQGKNVYAAKHPVRAQKTEKKPVHKVVVEPTKEHPAQVTSWNENVVVGTFTTRLWTGTISPGKKSEVLGRVDKMIRAVKKARQRANATSVVKADIGKKILDFVLGEQ